MRTIAVTGSASGIGAAVSEQLGAEGHTVIGVDLRDGDVTADLSSAEGRRAAVAGIREAAGGVLHGLVCSAGISALDRPVPGREGTIIRTNYFGTAELLAALRSDLAASGAGAAVVVSSWAQFRPWPLPEAIEACLAGDEERAAALVDADPRQDTLRPAYPTAKQALATLVRRSAPTAEWAGAGITLNATVPGVTRTAMTANRLSTEEGTAELLRRAPVPIGYIASAEDQADLITFFASGRGRYVTGQVIPVDGGLDAKRRGLDPIRPLEEERWT